jgi:hypothetical protein
VFAGGVEEHRGASVQLGSIPQRDERQETETAKEERGLSTSINEGSSSVLFSGVDNDGEAKLIASASA